MCFPVIVGGSARGYALRCENFCAAKRAAGIAPEYAPEKGRAILRRSAKKPDRFPGRALGHMGLTAQNLIPLPFLRHCLNSATAVNSASDEELMAVSSESL